MPAKGVGGARQGKEDGMMAWRHDGKGRQAAWPSHDCWAWVQKKADWVGLQRSCYIEFKRM